MLSKPCGVVWTRDKETGFAVVDGQTLKHKLHLNAQSYKPHHDQTEIMAHISLSKTTSLPPEMCVSLGHTGKESDFPGEGAQSGQMSPCSKGVTVRTSLGRTAGTGDLESAAFTHPFSSGCQIRRLPHLACTRREWLHYRSEQRRHGLPEHFLAWKKPAQTLSLGNGLIFRCPTVSTVRWESPGNKQHRVCQTAVTPQQD